MVIHSPRVCMHNTSHQVRMLNIRNCTLSQVQSTNEVGTELNVYYIKLWLTFQSNYLYILISC